MANIKPKVLMGFEDELITKKYQSYVNYMTNKAGGKPEWIENKQVANPVCKICGLTLPLVVQIYAPLEGSQYHRTLYLFGCVNPNCWNQENSWVCLRSQLLDSKASSESERCEKTVNTFDWCEGADAWEDEENGNIVEEIRNRQEFDNGGENLNRKMAALDFNECIEEWSSAGATCNAFSPTATAELEGGEDEVVTIDSPSMSQVDVPALLDQVKPVPQVSSERLEFASFFISVYEENEAKQSSLPNLEFSDQVMADDGQLNPDVNNPMGIDVNFDGSEEKYEKTLPPHGDKLFHHFVSRIQRHPGQILRYIRDGGAPLFLYPARDVPRSCQHCHGELVWELQLLPTLISRLQLVGSGYGHIDYGTVFVLACRRSCWLPQDSVRSEYVLVQREL